MMQNLVRDQLRPRRARFAAIGIGLIVLLNLAVTSAAATNTAALDNGTCVSNLQIGFDPTASSSNLPRFLLTGDGAGSTYAMKIDGTAIGSFTANAAGNVCVSTTVPLLDGAHQLTGTESSPHSGVAITPFDFSVDTVRPLVPGAPVLSPSTNSGDPNDNVTSFRQVLMTGTATPGVQVVLKNTMVNPQAVIGTGMTDAEGHYAITTIQLNGGIVRVIAWPIDGAGNTSVVGSNAFIMIIDSTAPPAPTPTLDPASDTEPLGDNTTTIATPVITGNGEGTLTIALSVDGVPVGTTVSDYNGNWYFTLPTQSTGTHAIRAGATDVAGNVGPISNPLSLTIGNAVSATVPGAPTLTSAAPSNTTVGLGWTAPSSNGGSPITGYTVTANPGGATCTTSGLGCTVSGLTNGTAYSFTVTATNAVGTGAASNALSATPRTVPSVPTLTSATPGNASVALAWTAPFNGGSPITGYTATANPGGATCTTSGLGCTVIGLTNGTSYSFTVTATNAAGSGPGSNALSATPVAGATVPGAPTLNSATPGNASATLGWTAPASNGGSAITGYTATASPGGATCTTSGLGCTVSGLANGTSYSFTVTATNAVGTGAASNALSATPRTVPGAPTLTSATAGNASVALAWTAPGNGGSAITGYTATANPGGATCTTSGLGCTVSGLANGTSYSFTVTATNAAGTGAASNPLSATPVAAATVPSAPTLNSATAGNASVVLGWTAPASNGGSAITGYTATASPGGATCTTSGLGCTVSGLANGTSYSFTVTATNAVGTGAASNALSATPRTVPGAPTLTSATAGNASVALAWTAPGNGGSAITGYTATANPGGATCTTSGLGCTVSGLTNGTSYSFTVTATNAAGTGPASNALSATPVAAATVPSAPTLNSATAGNASATLAWTAPASNGGSAINGYWIYRGLTSGTEQLYATTTNLSGWTDGSAVNGVTYYYQVSAVNAVGTSVVSNALSATPRTVPGAPTLTSATPGNASVALAWTAPGNGGSAITGYTVTASPGGATCTTSGLGCTVSGLTNGTSYSFTVTATNAAGTGAASNPLSATPVAPATVPSAPTLNSATAGNASVVLGWTAPASNGGSAITGYTATASPGGATCTTSGLGCTVSGLANGTSYSFTVTATNAVGTGAASNALSATPRTVPGAPTLTSATAGNASVALAWTAPGNGGSAITGYTATANPGGATCTTSGLGCTVSGLTNGTSYSFTVTATNAAGTGPASNALSATPVAAATVPSAPTLNSATAGNASATLAWTAPASNGGSAINGYWIYRGLTSGTEQLYATTTNLSGWTDGSAVNGVTYYYQVSAVNAVGTSVVSNELSATPRTVPGAPTLTSATPGNASVALAWTAPGNGGSAITGYTATASPGGATCTTSGLGCTVSGLANGTSYSFTVTATNAAGTGAASNALLATPTAGLTVPSAPTLNSATPGNASVSLGWTAPASNGGSSITGYRIYRGTASGGETLLSTTGTLPTFTDNTAVNGVTYYYEVSAVNGVGEGAVSGERSATPSAPISVPGAPTLTSAIPGNTTVALAWGAPASNGGSAITGYTATASPGGATCTTSGLGCTVAGLTNGTSYSFTVTATNVVGTGSPSNALAATPVAAATVPGAPTLTSATPGNAIVAVAWTAPASDGGSAITGYTATASPGGATCTTSGLGCTVAGLTNGTSYSFTVTATNAIGTGSSSNAMVATPAAPGTVPGAPSQQTAKPNVAEGIQVIWKAPTSTGTSPIIAYKIYRSTVSGAETYLATTGNVLNYIDSAVTNGATYYYKVSAVNSTGEGAKSSEKSAKRGTAPSAPRSLAASTATTTGVLLRWSTPSTNGGVNVTNYRIYRSTTSGTEALLITVGAVTSYTDTTAAHGIRYYYWITAVNPLGESVASNESSALGK